LWLHCYNIVKEDPLLDWPAPERPAELTEHRLLHAILSGEFAPESYLPAERELAAQLGVTRPTLREVLHRLARDGWFDIQHGKQTRVRDYWREGNLNVLSALVRHNLPLPTDFVPNLLAVRLCLAPAYTRAAVVRSADLVIDLLKACSDLPDTAESYATADWNLHSGLTLVSGNPVFTLILNGFSDFYVQMASLYFTHARARSASRAWYSNLMDAAHASDVESAEIVTREAMRESLELWQHFEQVEDHDQGSATTKEYP
jgi:GntR family negative regulator for fad regulon and positive regulator of fabA